MSTLAALLLFAYTSGVYRSTAYALRTMGGLRGLVVARPATVAVVALAVVVWPAALVFAGWSALATRLSGLRFGWGAEA